MKKILISLLVCLNSAQGFEPICQTPRSFSVKEIQHTFKNDNYNHGNSLIVYSVNPPTPIDWKTPGSALKSIVRNSFIKEGYDIEEIDNDGQIVKRKKNIKTHFIGHMFMELKCAGFPAIMTGMTSSGKEEIAGLMLEGKGFQQIISPTKGNFNSSEELNEEVELRKEKVGNLHYMGINLQASSCRELLKYFTEFHACGVSRRYGGLNANPHKAEGAGCSAFALSFLQRLNLISGIDEINPQEFGSEFIRDINIPKIMFKSHDKDLEVGAWGLLKGNKIAWAKDHINGRHVRFFDPELFSSWVQKFTYSKNNTGLIYLGRDGNKLINGVWFEQSQSLEQLSQFNLDYLLK